MYGDKAFIFGLRMTGRYSRWHMPCCLFYSNCSYIKPSSRSIGRCVACGRTLTVRISPILTIRYIYISLSSHVLPSSLSQYHRETSMTWKALNIWTYNLLLPLLRDVSNRNYSYCGRNSGLVPGYLANVELMEDWSPAQEILKRKRGNCQAWTVPTVFQIGHWVWVQQSCQGIGKRFQVGDSTSLFGLQLGSLTGSVNLTAEEKRLNLPWIKFDWYSKRPWSTCLRKTSVLVLLPPLLRLMLDLSIFSPSVLHLNKFVMIKSKLCQIWTVAFPLNWHLSLAFINRFCLSRAAVKIAALNAT